MTTPTIATATTAASGISGRWVLSFTPAPTCRLPDALTASLSVGYAAEVTSTGAHFDLTFSGASALSQSTDGTLAGDTVALNVNITRNDACDTVSIRGTGSAPLQNGVARGAFDGVIAATGCAGTTATVTCDGRDHNFEFRHRQ